MSDPADSLECYLVGGAVRDALLERPAGDRDWVVIGATPEQMVELGFKPVGVDFPVFLHPVNHEEYALARTERKSAPGYRGFTIHADPDVTLEEDLARRDLTINAMAQSRNGDIVDPFDGRSDTSSRVLRHVSDAFAEDPVRLLRVARFAARYSDLEFSVAPETVTLMKQLVNAGEVDALVAERVWTETRRALDERKPSVFFEVLRECGALKILFPEIDALFGVPQPARYHPEIDSGVHVMMALDVAARLKLSNRTRYAVLMHDLGKALTPDDELPSHRDHERRGVESVIAVSERLKVPSDYRDLAKVVCREHLRMHKLSELRPGKVLDLLEAVGSFRQGGFLEDFALACECDARGRAGLEDRAYPQGPMLRAFSDAAGAVRARDIQAARVARHGEPLIGKALGDAIAQARIAAIKEVQRNLPENLAAR